MKGIERIRREYIMKGIERLIDIENKKEMGNVKTVNNIVSVFKRKVKNDIGDVKVTDKFWGWFNVVDSDEFYFKVYEQYLTKNGQDISDEFFHSGFKVGGDFIETVLNSEYGYEESDSKAFCIGIVRDIYDIMDVVPERKDVNYDELSDYIENNLEYWIESIYINRESLFKKISVIASSSETIKDVADGIIVDTCEELGLEDYRFINSYLLGLINGMLTKISKF